MVGFDGVGSVAIGAEIETFLWDFDADGVIDFESDSPNAEWSFDSPGIQLVQLSLVDAEGCERAADQLLCVHQYGT